MLSNIINNYQDILFNTARIFSSVFEIMLAYILVNNFYIPKIKNKTLCMLPFFLLATGIILLQEFGLLGEYKYVAESIVLILYLLFLYEGSIKIKAVGSIIFVIMVMISEILSAMIFALLSDRFGILNNGTTFIKLLGITLSNIVMIIIAIIISVFVRNTPQSYTSFRLWLALLSVPLITLITFSVYQYYIENYPEDSRIMTYILFSAAGLLFINILVFTLFSRLRRQLNIKRENDILTSQLVLQENSIKNLENSYNRTRAFRHDIKNHILLMNMMLEQNNYTELKNYLKEMSTVLDESSYVRISGIPAVDAILNEKLYEAQGKNITTNFDIINLDKNNIKPLDMCIILSNALDNALEANEKIENPDERYIKLKIHGNEAFSVISISNPTAQAPKKTRQNNLFRTTKEDADNHGFGLKSIENTVQKYKGEMLTKCEDNVFTLVIRLNSI